jgi:hypothetical protein
MQLLGIERPGEDETPLDLRLVGVTTQAWQVAALLDRTGGGTGGAAVAWKVGTLKDPPRIGFALPGELHGRSSEPPKLVRDISLAST